MKPLLSVVVPVLDEAAGTVATLRMLAPLHARCRKFMVAVGGSRDATVTLAQTLAGTS